MKNCIVQLGWAQLGFQSGQATWPSQLGRTILASWPEAEAGEGGAGAWPAESDRLVARGWWRRGRRARGWHEETILGFSEVRDSPGTAVRGGALRSKGKLRRRWLGARRGPVNTYGACRSGRGGRDWFWCSHSSLSTTFLSSCCVDLAPAYSLPTPYQYRSTGIG
jgi:hypothetical protein